MLTRRNFISNTSKTALFMAFLPNASASDLKKQFERTMNFTPGQLATDEDFWESIAQAYTVDRGIINLNNGGVSPQAKPVQEAFEKLYEQSNLGPSYYMWRIIDKGREPLRQRLAAMAGCDKEELAINRNTTEALGTVVFGLNLKPGDEVVLTKMDYPNMIQAWKQREKRDGIKLVWIDLQLPSEDEESLVSQYVNAFTSKTKVLHLTHIINWCGQILPAKKIIAKAHEQNIEVILDAAHSFAHFDFKLSDLNCDYAGTSLHKWLGAPFGNGFMYVKKDKIKSLWPLFPNDKPDCEDIRKFEVLGTRNFATEQAINSAIDFHEMIGTQRKEARLRYLKNYWCMKVKNTPGVKLNTSLSNDFSCALAHVEVKGLTAGQLEAKLFNDYKIHTSPIAWEYLNGVRITPNVYTRLPELDKLVTAINIIAEGQ